MFQANIRRSRDLIEIFRVMNIQTTDALDFSDVLRASLVMSISALDHFIHEIVRTGMLDSYRQNELGLRRFSGFKCQLKAFFMDLPVAPIGGVAGESDQTHQHGHLSFQMPDRIAEARFRVWRCGMKYPRELGMTQREVKDRMALIVQRRNKIAHEADTIPDYARQIIHSDCVRQLTREWSDAISFIEKVAGSIYSLVSQQDSKSA